MRIAVVLRVKRQLLLGLLLGVFCVPSQIWAANPVRMGNQTSKGDRVRAEQLKSITKKRRHELTPIVAASLNDNYVQSYAMGLNYVYNISEGFAFELAGAYALSQTTSLVSRLRSGTELIDPQNPNDKQILNPNFTRLQIYAYGGFMWAPLMGKFALGGYVFDMEFYLAAGAGYIRTDADNLPSGHFGAGARIFFSTWFALRFDLRDHVFVQSLPTPSQVDSNVLSHKVMFTIGLTFLLPTRPFYSFNPDE